MGHSFIPYLVFLLTYLTFSFAIYEPDRELFYTGMDLKEKLIHGFFFVALNLMSFYFLGREVQQMCLVGGSYFCDTWNYVDFIPPLMIISALLIDVFLNPEDHPKIPDIQLSC